MPTFSYKGYDFDVDHTPTEQEFAQMSAYVDTLPPKQEKTGILEGLGKGFLQGGSRAMTGLDMAAAGLASLAGDTQGANEIFSEMEKREKFYKEPNMQVSGIPAKIASGLAQIPYYLNPSIAATSITGSGAESGKSVLEAGGDIPTAQKAQAISTGLNTAMVAIPPLLNFGKLAGGLSGAGLAAGQTYLDPKLQNVLREQNNLPAVPMPEAEDYAASIALGGGFGAAIARGKKAPPIKDMDMEAAIAEKQQKAAPQQQMEMPTKQTELELGQPNQYGMRPSEFVIDENGIPIRRDASIEAQTTARQGDLFSQENITQQGKSENIANWQLPDEARGATPDRSYLKQQEIEQAYLQREQQLKSQIDDSIAIEDQTRQALGQSMWGKSQRGSANLGEIVEGVKILGRKLSNLGLDLSVVKGIPAGVYNKTERWLRDFTSKDNVMTAVVRDGDGNVVGFADMAKHPEKADALEIAMIRVNPEYQRQGIGTEMVKAIEESGFKIAPSQKVTGAGEAFQKKVLGQTGFGKGQRGSIGARKQDPFESYSQRMLEQYPDATPETIQRAWELKQQREAQAQSSTIHGIDKATKTALEKNPAWRDKINSAFIPVENIEKTKETLRGWDQDISDNLLLNKMTSGGVMQAAHANNPVTSFGIDVINSLKKQSNIKTNEALLNPNDGILTGREYIKKVEGPDAFNNTVTEYVKASLDPEYKPTYSKVGQQWVDNLKTKLQEVLDRRNAVAEKLGLKPITNLNNYFSLMREGPFGFVVKDSAGKMIGFVRERSKARASDARAFYEQQIAEQGLDYSIGDVEYNAAYRKSPFNKTARGQQLSMEDLMRVLGEDDPNVLKVSEIYNQKLLKEARQTSGAHQREKFRTGVEGAKGTKQWMNQAENVKEAVESIETYFRQMNDQIASLEALKQISDVINDPSIKAPNAKKLIQSYYDHAFNRVDRITEAFKGITERIEKNTGRDIEFYLDGIRVGKNALMAMTLGFANLRFLATQVVHPAQVLPPLFGYLKSIGLDKGSSIVASSLGLKDGVAYFAQQYSKSTRPKFQDKITASIWDYAEKNHITAAHLFEAPREFSSQAAGKVANVTKRLAMGEMQNVEGATRMQAFSSITRYLLDNGIALEEALPMAERMTEFTMVSYELHNKPQMYSHFGPLGELASTLRTFQHNNIGQQSFYLKQAAQGKPRAALTQQMMNMMLWGGAIGLIGMAEADGLTELFNSWFGTNARTPSEIAITELPQTIAVGGLSTVSGFDFQSSLGAMQTVPGSASEAAFPLASKVANIAEAGVQLAKNPTKENLGKFARQPISSFAGAAEKLFLTEKEGKDKNLYRNPTTGETESIRTDAEVFIRGVTGLKPIRESIEAKQKQFLKKDDQFRIEKRSSLLKQIKQNTAEIMDARESGNKFRENAAKNRNQELYKSYLQYGGSETSIDTMLQEFMVNRSATTPVQRKKMQSAEGDITQEKALQLQKFKEIGR